MEQYTNEYGIDGADQASANCAIDVANDTNGRTEITSIVSSEKNGGSYVVSAIAHTIKSDSELISRGIKDWQEDSRGWTSQVYLKPLGTKELKAVKKFRAGIAAQSSIHRSEVPDSALSRARCSAIKGLIYLSKNKLMTV